jgi:phosphate uptake regulator
VDEHCVADEPTRATFERMSTETQWMVTAALNAFLQGDSERAEEVLLHDDMVDELYSRTVRGMEEYMKCHPSEVRGALSMMSVAKYLERVADHATNVAEEVIFVVRGEDVRHCRSAPALHSDDFGEDASVEMHSRSLPLLCPR